MSSVENIRLGDCIMPTAYRYRSEKFLPPSWEVEYVSEIRPLSTQPLLVVAIDAPFVLCEQLVTDCGKAFVLDARYCDWTKISKRFVREYCRMNELIVPKAFATRETVEQAKAAQEKACPLCAAVMSERLAPDKQWRLTCRECQMGLVPMSGVKS